MPNGRTLTLVVFLLALAMPRAAFGEVEPAPDVLRACVASGRLAGLRRPDFGSEGALVKPLYESVMYAPLWLDEGRPSARAEEAIAVLRSVDRKGLDPRDYDVDLLADEAARLGGRGRVPEADLARFDVALSVGLARLLSDLRLGRVDPSALGFGYDLASKRAGLAGLVAGVATAEAVGAAVAAAEPPLLERALLEEQLTRYRRLAADTAVPPVVLVPPIRPGARLEAAPQLARWLGTVGDRAADAPGPVGYDGPLVAAVRRFQARHGLAPDGVIGTATAQALAVPPAMRARQIELALERLRWLPTFALDRAVIVNVAGFELLAFDAIGAGRPPVLTMPVVVGRALRTQTPFFAGLMTNVVFAPYWNVPPSILRNEILPKLRTKPGYLAAENMEIVSDGRVLAPTAQAIARLAQGSAEVRQRPGPKNALGRVKFLFPNAHNVYMHDTPARELFARSRRDFSHGCIRLADAPAFAHWVLGGEGWDAARVDAMLGVGHQTFAPLRRPITVVIAYATAVARPDGTMEFYDDIYEHDAALERALGARAYRP
jgi:murein L,D-transpeptidase YcbB/YkuD